MHYKIKIWVVFLCTVRLVKSRTLSDCLQYTFPFSYHMLFFSGEVNKLQCWRWVFSLLSRSFAKKKKNSLRAYHDKKARLSLLWPLTDFAPQNWDTNMYESEKSRTICNTEKGQDGLPVRREESLTILYHRIPGHGLPDNTGSRVSITFYDL